MGLSPGGWFSLLLGNSFGDGFLNLLGFVSKMKVFGEIWHLEHGIIHFRFIFPLTTLFLGLRV
jgi:hypothetical protein